MIEIDDIGKWPKMLEEEPDRPHDLFDDEDDESDVPWEFHWHNSTHFHRSENIYFAIEVLLEFHKLGLYPPPWALNELAVRFKKHLENPDPELFALQFGVSGRGSGSANPYKEYLQWNERIIMLRDLGVLIGGFEISFTAAAKAIIEKHQSDLSPKTLMNNYRDIYGRPDLLRRKNIRFGPFLSVDDQQHYLSTFPRRAQRYIKDKTPPIT